MGEQGFLCPNLGEDYGGSGVDWGFAVIINEELERVGSGFIGFGLHSDITVPYIAAYGSEAQKERWFLNAQQGKSLQQSP